MKLTQKQLRSIIKSVIKETLVKESHDENLRILQAWAAKYGMKEEQNYEFTDAGPDDPIYPVAIVDDYGDAIAGIGPEGNIEINSGEGWRAVSADELNSMTPEDITNAL